MQAFVAYALPPPDQPLDIMSVFERVREQRSAVCCDKRCNGLNVSVQKPVHVGCEVEFGRYLPEFFTCIQERREHASGRLAQHEYDHEV